MIEIVAYDWAWPSLFEAESADIRRAMGERALRVEHVGSTAVPGLAAKPIIDIQVSVASLKTLEIHSMSLAGIGYHHTPLGPVDSVYPFFEKPASWPNTHHVHLCVAGTEQEHRHIAFRNYLRSHPEAGAEYAALKRTLAAAHVGATLESRERYSLAKTPFVNSVLKLAQSSGYPRGVPP